MTLSCETSVTSRTQSGIWSLVDEHPVLLAEREAGRPVVLVPSEYILLQSVHLPLASARQRREALPFALEDMLSEPGDTLHLVLGEALEAEHYLAAAIDHARMQEWCARLEAVGLGDAQLVPDVLALPIPAAGSWSTHMVAERLLVRTADGAGFATAPALLEPMRALAGMPVLEPQSLTLEVVPLDLRQGSYAPRHFAARAPWRRFALVAACGLAAHGGIAVLDTLALGRLADARKAETETLVSIAMPGTYLGEDLAGTAASLLSTQQGGSRTDFLPLMARTASVLAPLQPGLDGLSYSDGRLRLVPQDRGQAGQMRAALRPLEGVSVP